MTNKDEFRLDGRGWGRWLRRPAPRMFARLIDSPLFLDCKQFSAQLARERARANRANKSFVLLTFDLRGTSKTGEKHLEIYEDLARTILTRARCSDVAGEWEEKIGLVLIDASFSIVQQYVEGIECQFHETVRRDFGDRGKLPEIVCEAYSYPPTSQELALQAGESVRRTPEIVSSSGSKEGSRTRLASLNQRKAPKDGGDIEQTRQRSFRATTSNLEADH